MASPGGHISELDLLSRHIEPSPDSLWITAQSTQTDSLLRGRRTHYVPYVRPRDIAAAVRAGQAARPVMEKERFDVCISTGAGLALLILSQAPRFRMPAVFVESLTRLSGPSLTGRLLHLTPGVTTMTQHSAWATSGWGYAGNLLDNFAPSPRQRVGALRLFVTLGTIKPYRFDRAIDGITKVLRPTDDVTWQLGSSLRGGLQGQTYEWLPVQSMSSLMQGADTVACHSGVGSVLEALEAGKCPVLLTRSARFGEHVDEHQRRFADHLVSRGLAYELDMQQPSRSVLETAAAVSMSSSV
ncbi:glycosyltransferase [Blastococcus sp. SYSU DS0828]